MKIGFLLTIILGGMILFAYTWIEWRVNQKACGGCGRRVSVAMTGEPCPRCGAPIR